MNRGGFVALMDAVIFSAVILVALSALLGLGITAQDGDDRDVSAILGSVMSAEVRMSDLAEDGDGSMVRVSDLCALWVSTGDGAVEEYLGEALDALSGGRSYRLDLSFGENSRSIGDGGVMESMAASADVPVTTGGTLNVELRLYRS